jgi:hypothetical protein
MILDTLKLTLDTDDGRMNGSPTIVVAGSRRIAFYEKFFTSGLIGYSPLTAHITATALLEVSVPAGSGTLNGSPISWSADTETLPIDSFVCIRVDAVGVIHYSTSWDMTEIASSVVLAYVNVGNTAIVTVEEVEKTGRYIYARKQELSGSSWVWSGEETILCTGQEPNAFYDTTRNKVFLSYKKDSVIYLRVFDLTTELTFRYLPNIQISVGVISLNHNPDVSLAMKTSAGAKSLSTVINSELYPMSVTGLCFVKTGINYEPYVYLPYIISNSNFQYLVYPYYVEVCTKSGSVYTVEDSVAFYANGEYSSDRWHQWTGSLGVKYLRIRAQCPLLIQGDVVTPEASYGQVEIFNPFDKKTVDGNTISDIAIPERQVLSPSAGVKSMLAKTSEFIESKDFEQDTITFGTAASLKNLLTKTSEFIESNALEQDSVTFQTAAGSKTLMTITNS